MGCAGVKRYEVVYPRELHRTPSIHTRAHVNGAINAKICPLFKGTVKRRGATLTIRCGYSHRLHRQKLPAIMFFGTKRLSCGIVVLTEDRELLLCHVTGQNHWDLPKGGIDIGEFPIDAALRETREETGLRLDAGALLDIGRLHYTLKKDLHLFAARSVRLPLSSMHCETFYVDRYSRRLLPEMDGYGWFDFARVPSLCTPKMAALLGRHVDPEALLRALALAPSLPQSSVGSSLNS